MKILLLILPNKTSHIWEEKTQVNFTVCQKTLWKVRKAFQTRVKTCLNMILSWFCKEKNILG